MVRVGDLVPRLYLLKIYIVTNEWFLDLEFLYLVSWFAYDLLPATPYKAMPHLVRFVSGLLGASKTPSKIR